MREHFVILSLGEAAYWSNEYGWTRDRQEATIFEREEKEAYPAMPCAKGPTPFWLTLEEASGSDYFVTEDGSLLRLTEEDGLFIELSTGFAYGFDEVTRYPLDANHELVPGRPLVPGNAESFLGTADPQALRAFGFSV